MQRYKDAILRPSSIENRITSAITCLEALYLKADERAELSRRLSQRMAAMLSYFGFQPVKVSKEIARAYEIRSTYIHGSQIEHSAKEDAQRLCKLVLDYTRISLLVFLQVVENEEKDKILSRLDNSLLDEKARKRLDSMAKEVITGARRG